MEAQRGAPPSTYAILAAIEGQEGAWRRVAVATAIRSLMIAPGLWIAGVRGWKVATGALAGSIGITAVLYAYYALIKARQAASATIPATATPPTTESTTEATNGDSSLN